MRGCGPFVIVVWLIVRVSATAAAAPNPEQSAGLALMESRGCLACHSTDGTRNVGPTLLGLAGQTVDAVVDGSERPVAVDSAYLRQSIIEPNQALRPTYPAHTMPTIPLNDPEIGQIVAAIEYLARPDVVQQRGQPEGGMWLLIVGMVLFVGGHLGLSSGGIRDRMVARLGVNGFRGVYSLIALAGFALLVIGYVAAPYIVLWTPPLWTRYVPFAVMPIAFILLVGSSMAKNPTSVGQETVLSEGYRPRGLVSVTRHPMLWAFTLWGLCHIPPNGDAATVILALGIVVLAIGGMVHIDRRRRLALGEAWAPFARQTSLIPFAAVLYGRGRLDGRGLVLPTAAGAAAFVAILFTHEWIIGVSPLPYW